ELKNAEDRYVVQQLTRYYHKLQQVKPFSDRVDYHQPIMLMALSPQLHEDNAIDVLYHQLDFQLLTFQIRVDENQDLTFHLMSWKDQSRIRSISIGIISGNDLGDGEIDVPPPPRTFLNRLAKSTKINPQECLDVRARLLQLDPRIKEVKYDNSSYLYGLGKTNFLGGILFHPSIHKNSDVLWPRLMLRLPVKSRKGQSTLSRCLIPNVFITESHSAEDHDFLAGAIHAGTSINGKRTSEIIWIHIFLWNFLRRETQERIDSQNLISHLQAYCDRKNWPDPTVNREAALEFFLAIALEHWRLKL
ncbi:MAG: hypothetical protein O3C67_09630, partial [Cyanobacteria bacterium]|nr:hypothetical protein [Cyanobacteriota bacterium]